MGKMNWKRMAVAFVAGLLFGTALGGWGLKCHLERRWHHGEKRYERMLEHFSRKLNLAPEQKKKVGAVLETKRQRMKALRAEIRPKFEGLRKATETDIRNILTPEQQVAFDKMQSERESRWKKRKGDHP